MRWFRKPEGDPLAVSMSGLKLGDRLLMLGCSDTTLAAALATKVGLTGRACLLDESADRLNAAAAAIEQEGALIDSVTQPMSGLPARAGLAPRPRPPQCVSRDAGRRPRSSRP